MIGPSKAGKTTLATSLAQRTNMSVLNFSNFQNERGLAARTDEEKVKELIKYLVDQPAQRVLIEEFP
jgi:adenylate kinase family enzyme